MRVIAKRTLNEFWEQGYDDAKTPLTEWYNIMLKASWETPQQLKADIGTASILKGCGLAVDMALNTERPNVGLNPAIGDYSKWDSPGTMTK